MIEILLAAACLGAAALFWRRHTCPKRRLQALWRRLEAVLVRHDLPDGTLSVALDGDGAPSLHPIPAIPDHLRLALVSALSDGLAALPWHERRGIRHLPPRDRAGEGGFRQPDARHHPRTPRPARRPRRPSSRALAAAAGRTKFQGMSLRAALRRLLVRPLRHRRGDSPTLAALRRLLVRLLRRRRGDSPALAALAAQIAPPPAARSQRPAARPPRPPSPTAAIPSSADGRLPPRRRPSLSSPLPDQAPDRIS